MTTNIELADNFSAAADVILANQIHTAPTSKSAQVLAIQGLAYAQLAVAAQLGNIADAIRESKA